MEKIKGFKNTNILTEQGIIKTSLLIEGERISKIGDFECEGLIELPEDKIVIPGFIDQHTHGAGGKDAIDGSVEDIKVVAHSLPEEGTTSFLATTTTQSVDIIDQSLASIKEYIDLNLETGSDVIGIHLEGPFLNPRYTGAMLPGLIVDPDIELFKHFEEISGNNIKLVTMAIEKEGATEFIKYLKSKNITVAVGHANATYQDIKEGIKNGVTCATHTYNAMKPLRRDEIGTVGSVMLFDELYCEAICDGIHVSAPALKLLWKNKPNDKFIIVTDSLRAKYLPDGVYPEIDQIIIVSDGAARLETGRLAGSILKINKGVKNIMDFLDIDFETAVKCATENPAKNLGVYDQMGSIKEGKLANFVVVDMDVNVYQTIKRGKVIYKK